MPRHRRPHLPELVRWSLLGVVLGSVAGVALAACLRPLRRPPSRVDLRGTFRGRRQLTSGETAARVRGALQADPHLRDLALTVLGIAPGVVEVRGWVDDRASRGRLARLGRSVNGVETLVNSILVRGEDDPPPPPSLQLSDRTA